MTQNGKILYPYNVDAYNRTELYVGPNLDAFFQKYIVDNPCPAGTTQVPSNPAGGVCFVFENLGNYFYSANIAANDKGLFVTSPYLDKISKIALHYPCSGGTQLLGSTGVCSLRTWGSHGSGHNQFDNSNDVAVDSSGDVYVADVGNNRIEKFTNDGNYLLTIKPTAPKTFPLRIYVDQQCLYMQHINYSFYYQWYINTGLFGKYNFDPSKQDMAIVLNGLEISYGSPISIGSKLVYPPYWGFGTQNVLVFVENKGDPLHNHRLDPGELSARTTFDTKIC
jgi:hypothetical protein